MKKFIAFLLAGLVMFMAPAATLIASQDAYPTIGMTALAQDVPGNDEVALPDLPLTFDFRQYVMTFLYFAASVVALTSIINRFITGLKGFAKQYLSWFVSLAISFTAYFLNYGIFENLAWYQTLFIAIITGFGANGIFDWQLVQAILRALKLEPAIVKKE